MANTYLGSHPSHGYTVVEQIDSNKQLTWSDSGKLFMCHHGSSNILVNLPKLSSEICGWNAKFIRAATGAKQFLVTGHGNTTTTAHADSDGKVIYLEISPTSQAADSMDGVRFNGTEVDAAIKLGANFEIFTDGTYWYVLGSGIIGDDIAQENN